MDQFVPITGIEPGDFRLLAKPSLLTLRKPAGLFLDVFNGVFERQVSIQVPNELTITDGLEGGQGGVETPVQQSSHFVQPTVVQHPDHTSRDPIV